MHNEPTSEKKSVIRTILKACGFYRNPPYIEERLKEAELRAAMFLSAIVAAIEVWMVLRYINDWVIPGQVETFDEFFQYTNSFFILFGACVMVFIYSVLYLRGKLRFLSKFSRILIFLFFSLGIYFGILTSMKDFTKGKMIICFLTMLMWSTVICVWRPFTSVLITVFCGGIFFWLLDNYSFNKAGEQLHMNEGDKINYLTFLVIILILQLSVYFQRYGDATKSYRIRLSAVTDELTGIPNMRKFGEEAHAYCEKCFAEGSSPVYLVFDIGSFRTFNDRFGYAGGDELLKKTARLITEEFPNEPAARESGDCFCVLTAAEDHRERAERVSEKLKAAYPEETYLDMKTGAFAAAGTESDARRCVDLASYALRHAKNGSDNFCVYDEKMSKDHKLRQYVLNNLERAIKEGFIKVYWQPVMWSEDGSICGCEALARWIDPEMGFLSPGVFIPVLEEEHRIHLLDLCIYEQVCKQLRECLDKGLPALPTSMNFSRLDFELMDAVGELEKLVAKYDIPKEYLHVEITESAVTNDVAGLKTAMDRLHGAGYVIWLDDFGSGYSSLNVLKDFRFDLLKIDMEFLKNFSGNQNSRKIIGSIIGLADQLGMQTLCEGVETQEAVDFLREAGCGRLQGYFYGKPMPYEDILSRINDGTFRFSGVRH
ncbi:MAG: GGDEF domain-containing protein [Ruminiclostridium sp.]|nr:GGDEF domain-containing protein [Ruminiclostridium sp.]